MPPCAPKVLTLGRFIVQGQAPSLGPLSNDDYLAPLSSRTRQRGLASSEATASSLHTTSRGSKPAKLPDFSDFFTKDAYF